MNKKPPTPGTAHMSKPMARVWAQPVRLKKRSVLDTLAERRRVRRQDTKRSLQQTRKTQLDLFPPSFDPFDQP